MKRLALLAVTFSAATLASQAPAIGAGPGVFMIQGDHAGATVDAVGSVNLTNSPLHDDDFDFSGQWSFVDNGDGTVDFNGNMAFGDFATLTAVRVAFLGSMEGTVTVIGGEHTFGTDQSGVTADWDPDTLAFRYNVPSGGPNSNAGSNYTEIESSCEDSGSVAGNTICGTRENTTPEWEGVSIELEFSRDLRSFTGQVTVTEESGRGFTGNVTTISYSVSGTQM